MRREQVKENRMWSDEDIRRMCISNNYYTIGDCEDYDKLMRFVTTHKPTVHNIYKVACDIAKHSEREFSLKETVESIMFNIESDVVITTFDIINF